MTRKRILRAFLVCAAIVLFAPWGRAGLPVFLLVSEESRTESQPSAPDDGQAEETEIIAEVTANFTPGPLVVHPRPRMPGETRAGDEKIRLLTEKLAQNPEDPKVLIARAILYHDDGQFDAALADLGRALQLDPEEIAGREMRTLIHIRKRAFPAALADVNALLRQRPGTAGDLSLRAVIYGHMKEFEKALADLDRALELEPNAPEHHEARAIVYSRLRRPREAAAAIDSAIKLRPDNPDYLGLRANYLALAGDLDGASRDYDQLMKNGTADAVDHVARAMLLHLPRADYLAALADLEKAAQLAPDYVEVHNGLAWILATTPDLKMRDGARALSHATRAMELDSGRLKTLAAYAAALAVTGRFDEAVAIEERYSGNPELPEDLRDYSQKRLAAYRRREIFARPDGGPVILP